MQKEEGDHLSDAVKSRIEGLTRRPEQADGLLPTDGSPMLISADSSPCQKRALTLGPTLRRFNRYREALPYARAANDVNKQLGATEEDRDDPVDAECLERLPTDGTELTAKLGLPPGTIRDEDLRDETTGFRAVMYRDRASGQLILAARDTQPKSLVDWQTNTRNGQGRDTDQYAAMRRLSGRLTSHRIDFNLAGYSKGGGLAQEAGLINRDAQVYVFNSSGLHKDSLWRTGNSDFQSLRQRTHAFSASNDFLTFMNETRDPKQQIENVRFLRRELEGENRWWKKPMKIDHRNPAQPDGDDDPFFKKDRDAYFAELDEMIAQLERNHAAGHALRSFPPVRAAQKEVIPNSDTSISNQLGAQDPGLNLGKLRQHQMPRVLDPLEKNVEDDRETLRNFLKECP